MGCLIAAVRLDRRPPGRLFHLPVPDGPPFGDHVGAINPGVIDVPRHIHDVRVFLNADDVQVWHSLLDMAHQLGIHAERQRRGRRVLAVDFVDHLRDVVDGIEYGGIGVLQVGLVTDDPQQKSGVILVPEDFTPGKFKLPCNRLGIVVIESVALAADGNAHGHGQAVPGSLVQDQETIRRFELAPVSERVATLRRQAGDIPITDPRAFDGIGLAAAKQRVAALVFDNIDGYGAAVRRLPG